MRRVVAVGVLGLAGLPVLGPTAALAATPSETVRGVHVDASAWSWRTVAPAGSPVTEPSNVPAGDLAVAYDGRPDAPPAKATYLHLDLGDLPSGTQVTNLLLRLPVDASVQQDPTTAAVVACRLKAPFRPGTGSDPATMPAEDCSDAAMAVYDGASGSFTVLLTGFAADWAAGTPNDGIVLRPDPAAAVPTVMPFSLTLKGAAAVTGQLALTLPPVAAPPVAPVEVPPAPAPVPVVAGPPVLLPPAVPPAPSAPQVAPSPRPVPQPVGQVAAARQAATRAPFRASTAGFAAAGALGLLLLGVIGWSLGEMADPRWYARVERRRLDRLVRGAVVVPAETRVAGRRRVAQPTQTRHGRRPRSTAASTVTYS